MSKWLATLPVAFLLGACAHDYAYQPTEHATGTSRTRRRRLSESRPPPRRGDVRLASFGLSEARPCVGIRRRQLCAAPAHGGLEQRRRAVDRRQREQKLGSHERWLHRAGLPPTTRRKRGASADHGRRRIEAGSSTSLPDARRTSKSADSIPTSDAIWNVHAGAQDVVERTAFRSVGIEPVYGPESRRNTATTANGADPSGTTRVSVGIPRPWVGGAVMMRSPAGAQAMSLPIWADFSLAPAVAGSSPRHARHLVGPGETGR